MKGVDRLTCVRAARSASVWTRITAVSEEPVMDVRMLEL